MGEPAGASGSDPQEGSLKRVWLRTRATAVAARATPTSRVGGGSAPRDRREAPAAIRLEAAAPRGVCGCWCLDRVARSQGCAGADRGRANLQAALPAGCSGSRVGAARGPHLMQPARAQHQARATWTPAWPPPRGRGHPAVRTQDFVRPTGAQGHGEGASLVRHHGGQHWT